MARVPGQPNHKHFPKDDFVIDLVAGSCTCPAGQVARQMVPMATKTDLTGRIYKLEGFRFDAAVCGACPLRPQCTSAKSGVGRTVRLHPQEALLQEGRSLHQSPAYDEYRQRRVVAEHRLARLVQLRVRQARYFGRVKTKFQLYLAATVANLTLLADKVGVNGDPNPEFPVSTHAADDGVNYSANLRSNLRWVMVSLAMVWAAVAPAPKGVSSEFLGRSLMTVTAVVDSWEPYNHRSGIPDRER